MHSEYKRIVPGAECAFLFLHGILGTPRHFDAFVELVPGNVSVYNLLLDGHGKGVTDFSRTSMAKWEAQVHSAVSELTQTHEKLFIAAHSMGCLLAVGEAIREPKIAGLFFLAAPMQLFLKPRMVANSMKVYFNRIRPDDGPGMAAKRCCGISHSPNFLLYFGWIPRFLELFQKIRQTRNQLSSLSVPCAAYQSARDEMVSRRSTQVLGKNHHIRVTELPSSSHFYYAPGDQELLRNAFSDFVQRT